jgi:hypothetical protein
LRIVGESDKNFFIKSKFQTIFIVDKSVLDKLFM